MVDKATGYGAFGLTQEGEVTATDIGKPETHPEFNLQACMQKAIESKFKEAPINEQSNLYSRILAEMEKPLLEAVLLHTKNNHSQATRWLGLSRGTFREKLKSHTLLGDQKKSLAELNLIPKTQYDKQ